MARGLIEGALGGLAKAAGDIAGGHIKNEMELDFRKQLSDVEEQRQLRIQEAQEQTRRAGRQADFEQGLANAPRANQAKVDELKTVEPVRTGLEAERTTATAAARGAAERENEAKFAGDKSAQAGVRARAQAGDVGAGERALRMKELEQRIKEADLNAQDRAQIRDLAQQAAEQRAGGNEDGAQQVEMQIRTLLGAGAKGEKSQADMAAAAGVWERMANDIQKNLDDPVRSAGRSAAQTAALETEAARYRQRADETLSGVTAKRGIGRPSEAPAGAAPYPDGTELRGKDGQVYVVRGGRPVPKNAGRSASGTVTRE